MKTDNRLFRIIDDHRRPDNMFRYDSLEQMLRELWLEGVNTLRELTIVLQQFREEEEKENEQ